MPISEQRPDEQRSIFGLGPHLCALAVHQQLWRGMGDGAVALCVVGLVPSHDFAEPKVCHLHIQSCSEEGEQEKTSHPVVNMAASSRHDLFAMLYQKGFHIHAIVQTQAQVWWMQHGEGTKRSQSAPLTLQVKPLESLLLLQRRTLPPATQVLAACCCPGPNGQHCSWPNERKGGAGGASARAALATQAALLMGQRAMPPQARGSRLIWHGARMQPTPACAQELSCPGAVQPAPASPPDRSP